MNILTQKNILIISPESWGKSYLSKHFYALQLLRNNNKVWFLNSPYYKKDQFAIETELQNPGLTIIDDQVFRGIHQLPAFLQRIVIRKQIKKLQNKYHVKWDVIWSFDNSRYFFLDCFSDAAYRIHHVVDDHMDFQLKACCESADLCIGVTPSIVERIKVFNKNNIFLQHGFAEFERQQVSLQKGNESVNLVYIGNLLLKGFDRDLMIQLACEFKSVRFHLVGSYSKGNLNAGQNDDADFIRILQSMDNVVMYGEMPYDVAYTLATDGDILSIMYFDRDSEVAANSSKILPYLSTGKVIVSNYFEMYEGMNLLSMAKNRSDYKDLLKETIEELEERNSSTNQSLRQHYAKLNSYQHHLEKVDELLLKLKS